MISVSNSLGGMSHADAARKAAVQLSRLEALSSDQAFAKPWVEGVFRELRSSWSHGPLRSAPWLAEARRAFDLDRIKRPDSALLQLSSSAGLTTPAPMWERPQEELDILNVVSYLELLQTVSCESQRFIATSFGSP
jgi:hypothetical protein